MLSIILLPGALVILLAVLFSSGVAPQYLLSLASAQSGLDLSAEQFTISLQGTLRFGRVSASLPEEEHPFFIANKLEIYTGGLVDLITRSHRSISRIRVTGPVLTLSEDESGDLNIAPLLSRFGNGSKNSAAAEPYSIPSIVLNNAAVHYKRLKSDPLSVTGLMLEFHQSDDETVAFKTTLPGQNTLYGTMNLTTFAHSLTLRIENFDALSEGLKSTLPNGFVIQADWNGIATSDPARLADGNLTVRHLHAAGVDGSLQAAVTIGTETAKAQIRELQVNPWRLWSPSNGPLEPLRSQGGKLSIHYADLRIGLDDLAVTLLGGEAVVSAELYPRDWFDSRGEIEFSAFETADLGFSGVFKDGTMSGLLRFEPAVEARAMEPMAVSLRLEATGEAFERAGLEDITAKGYLGKTRLVTDGACVGVFGGQVMPWVSLTFRENEMYTHVIADIEDLEAGRLFQWFSGESKPIPGKLSGTLRGRTVGSLETLTGSADIRLTESDLINVKAIGVLYSAMKLGAGSSDTGGTGTANVSVHGDRIEIMNFKYFNRGAEVRGTGVIESASQGKDSPVSGVITGSMQPLRNAPIPGSREMDRLLSGLQAGLVTVKIDGTLGDVQARSVPAPEVQSALRALFGQQD